MRGSVIVLAVGVVALFLSFQGFQAYAAARTWELTAAQAHERCTAKARSKDDRAACEALRPFWQQEGSATSRALALLAEAGDGATRLGGRAVEFAADQAELLKAALRGGQGSKAKPSA